jgi:cyclophilin family peptidyl-prolyl cis-trans isomerase
MKKIFTLTFLIIAVALLLAGCQTSSKPLTETSLSFSDRELAAGGNALNGNQSDPASLQSESYQLTNQKISNTNRRGNNMKQLSDFTEIAAKQVTITTDKGPITIELFREQAPITTANFLELANSGFYNGVRFHRIIKDFMAQVGDPLSKDMAMQPRWGTGGPGYTIPDEFVAELKHDAPGIVSMANAGPNTGGSQFFITYEPTPWLDGKHTVFGKVVSGMEVVEQLEIGDAIQSIQLQ